MRASTLFTTGLAALASAAPLETRAADDCHYFQVSNFVYGCTTTCDWSFDVTVHGNSGTHPAFDTPVTCTGSLTDKDYVTCSKLSDTSSISAYIKKSNNNLKLQYEVNLPREGARYNYFGHKHVNAATSGKPQKDAFKVKESRATGVA